MKIAFASNGAKSRAALAPSRGANASAMVSKRRRRMLVAMSPAEPALDEAEFVGSVQPSLPPCVRRASDPREPAVGGASVARKELRRSICDL